MAPVSARANANTTKRLQRRGHSYLAAGVLMPLAPMEWEGPARVEVVRPR
jgi:hypothetical protein